MRKRVTAAGLFAGLLLVPAGAAHAAGYTCDGQAATIVSSKRVVTGTSGADVIVVTGKRAHTVYGLGGNDIICGSAGNDTIYGGNGADTILGGRGNDKEYGQAGADVLSGGKGSDQLFGGTGNDDLDGNDGTDIENGGRGTDVLHADDRDHVFGAASERQDDSEQLTLSADEIALQTVLTTGAQALYDGLVAVPATVTGTGNQATLPVDATVAPYNLTSDQLALILHVTWNATPGEDEDGPRGCVDGTAADSGRSFKVRLEARDGHDAMEHGGSSGPELKFTLGTCAFTWEREHEGVTLPAAVSAALAAASGVSVEHPVVTAPTDVTSGTLARLFLDGTVTGSGHMATGGTATNASETSALALIGSGTGYDLTDVYWNVHVDGTMTEAHGCLVAVDTVASPNVTYHQSVEVEFGLHDGVQVYKVEMHNLAGGCYIGS